MTDATTSSDEKLFGFPGPNDSTEKALLSWIRGVVQSNHRLVEALERLRRSYKLASAGRPDPDASETLWMVEIALSDAYSSRNATAVKSSLGPEKA
jgi:hypothetical protein